MTPPRQRNASPPTEVTPINPPAARPESRDRFSDRDYARDRRIRVVGPHTVYDTPPGEVATVSLTNGQLDALIKAGHVVVEPEQEDRPSPAATKEA